MHQLPSPTPVLEGAWAAKYKDAGLVVLGVHSPEFGFEKDRANVERAVRELNVSYPTAIDSNSSRLACAFAESNTGPPTYLIDGKGQIRHHHFGEGDYEQSERVIQDLLKENGAQPASDFHSLQCKAAQARGYRSAAGFWQCALTGDVRRLQSRRELRVTGAGGAKLAEDVQPAFAVRAESVGTERRVDH